MKYCMMKQELLGLVNFSTLINEHIHKHSYVQSLPLQKCSWHGPVSFQWIWGLHFDFKINSFKKSWTPPQKINKNDVFLESFSPKLVAFSCRISNSFLLIWKYFWNALAIWLQHVVNLVAVQRVSTKPVCQFLSCQNLKLLQMHKNKRLNKYNQLLKYPFNMYCIHSQISKPRGAGGGVHVCAHICIKIYIFPRTIFIVYLFVIMDERIWKAACAQVRKLICKTILIDWMLHFLQRAVDMV